MKLLEQVVLSREDITKIENFFKIYDSDKKSPPSMTERLRAELDVQKSTTIHILLKISVD
jgi:hypothetical protein